MGCSPQSLKDCTLMFLVFLKKSLVCRAGAVPSPHISASYGKLLRPKVHHRGASESLLEDMEDEHEGQVCWLPCS